VKKSVKELKLLSKNDKNKPKKNMKRPKQKKSFMRVEENLIINRLTSKKPVSEPKRLVANLLVKLMK
jgi:hypothetical protein